MIFYWFCNPGDVQLVFSQQFGSTLTMKVDGPHEPGSGNQTDCTSRRKITMRPGGIFASAQLHIHPEVGGVDESEWEEKEKGCHSMQRWKTSTRTW